MPGIVGGIVLAVIGIALTITGARKGSTVRVSGNGRVGIMQGKAVVGLGVFLLVAGVVSVLVGVFSS